MLTKATFENVNDTTAEIRSLFMLVLITIEASVNLLSGGEARVRALEVRNLLLRTKEEIEDGWLLAVEVASGVVAPCEAAVLGRDGAFAVPHSLDVGGGDGDGAVGVEVLFLNDEVHTFTGRVFVDFLGNEGSRFGDVSSGGGHGTEIFVFIVFPIFWVIVYLE